MTALALVALFLAQPQNGTGVTDELRRAKNEYSYGSYDDAAKRLHGLLYPMRLTSDEQVIEARKYLALSYYLLDQTGPMGEEFEKLLYLDPDYQLDPFTVAPAVIEVFEQVRARLKPQLDVIRQRKTDESLASGGPRRIIEQRIVEKSELALWMPFGLGQLENGDRALGIFFAVVEAALLAGNVAAYLYLTYGLGDDYPTSDANFVRGVTITQYASLGLFLGVWAVGAVHAQLNFVPEVAEPPVVRDEGAAVLDVGPRAPGPAALVLGFTF